ncbi:MAG: anthrone oxygenase family protein [Saprospiraceae bacterium]
MYRNILLFTATLLTSLSAGLLFAYACSVNLGLHRLPDQAYLSAMQEINRAIQNPPFFLCFMGPVVLLPASAWMQRRQAGAFRWLLLATVFYLVGVFGVTMAGNVPLNQALDGFDITSANLDGLAKQRAAFEGPWGNWHLVRTVAAILAASFALAAIVFSKKAE